jgi:hypothetical protein
MVAAVVFVVELINEVDAAAATVVAVVVAVVEPQNASTLFPACVAPAMRLRHGGALGFFGCPVASPRRYALHSPSWAGPLTSGPTPRDAPSARVVDALDAWVTAPAVGAAATDPAVTDPPVDVAVVVGEVVLAALDGVDESDSPWFVLCLPWLRSSSVASIVF